MHSRFIRLILLFTILICLPLEGLASVTMPSCQMHGSKTDMQMDSMSDMTHCGMHKSDMAPKSTPCDKCTYCFLGAAQAIIMLSIPIHMDGISPMFTNLTTVFSDPIPTSFFHPPRLTLA
jgi:hypothetical protein